MKKLSIVCLAILILGMCSKAVVAQENFILDEKQMLSQVKGIMHNMENYDDLVKTSMQLLDVNSDGFVSDREVSNFIEGLNLTGNFNEAQKEQRHKDIMAFFVQADKTVDKKLSVDEFIAFWKNVEDWTIKNRFREMDRNGDGIYDEKDIPSREESLANLEKMKQRLENAVNQLQQTSPQEFVDNMMKNMMTAQIDEDFYQMDKNADNCVSRDEYADYNLNLPDNNDEEFSLTRNEYLEIYDYIEKKRPNCLTKEEYKADMEKPIDLEMSDIDDELDIDDDTGESPVSDVNDEMLENAFWQHIEQNYRDMDKNPDGCVSKDEFADYNLEMNENMPLLREDYLKIYNLIEKKVSDCLTVDEYKDYLK